MSNLLIVESKNDKIFIEALVKYLNINKIQLDKPICFEEDDYKCLQGLDQAKLTSTFDEIKATIRKKAIPKVGIIIDQDSDTKTERLNWLNDCLKKVYPEAEDIRETSQLYRLTTIEDQITEFACYFTNVEGQGELETVLKKIKSQDSTYADCLEDWRNCLNKQEKSIKDKDFDKFWISNYLRFDTCSTEDKKQAGRKCSMNGFDYVMKNKRHIWNFEHEVLNELKEFLQLFAV